MEDVNAKDLGHLVNIEEPRQVVGTMRGTTINVHGGHPETSTMYGWRPRWRRASKVRSADDQRR